MGIEHINDRKGRPGWGRPHKRCQTTKATVRGAIATSEDNDSIHS